MYSCHPGCRRTPDGNAGGRRVRVSEGFSGAAFGGNGLDGIPLIDPKCIGCAWCTVSEEDIGCVD